MEREGAAAPLPRFAPAARARQPCREAAGSRRRGTAEQGRLGAGPAARSGGLAALGVSSGFVADPQLTLFNAATQAQIDANNNWGGTTTLANAFKSVGAFDLPTTSTDAALLKQLEPGNYTVEVKPVTGTASGLGIVEVYEVP